MTEEFPFTATTSVFKVAGKMFALSALRSRPLKVSVKCDPELAAQLRISYPAIAPGYHLNKRHWKTITLDGSLEDKFVFEMLRTAMTWSSKGCRARRDCSSRASASPARSRRTGRRDP